MNRLSTTPILFIAALALIATMIFSSCDTALVDEPSSAIAAPLSGLKTTASFPGYTVTALGSSVAPNGRITYSYQVTGTDPGPPAFDWFFLEQACETTPTLTPRNAVGSAEVDGVSGYKWNAALPPGESRIYAFTYPAGTDITEGAISVTIQRGGQVHPLQQISGPCGEVLTVTISGFVFVDGNGDGVKGASDLGIGNVQVEIREGAGVVASGPTAGDGSFSLEVPAGGDYTIAIPAEAGGINATLVNSYEATGPLQAPHDLGVVNEDLFDNDFGYIIDPEAILEDLATTHQTNAQNANWWRMVAHHTNGGRCHEGICPNDMNALLEQILYADGDGENDYFLLPDPFALPPGTSMTQHARDLLWPQFPKTELEAVFRNLFAMQLNYFAGLGTGDDDYDTALISYLEQWVFTHEDYEPARIAIGQNDNALVETVPGVTEAGRFLSKEFQITEAYNDGGGGGGGVD